MNDGTIARDQHAGHRLILEIEINLAPLAVNVGREKVKQVAGEERGAGRVSARMLRESPLVETAELR